MAVNYEMRMKLTKFIGSRIIESEDENGVVERGVFIPIDKNCLFETENGDVLVAAFVNENMLAQGGKNNVSHIIKQKTNPKHAQKLRDLGYKGSLTLGTMFLAKTNYNLKSQQMSGKRVKIEQD
jgi:hypothetical protein